MGNQSRLLFKTHLILYNRAPFGQLIISLTWKDSLPKTKSWTTGAPCCPSLYAPTFQPEHFNLEKIMNLKRKRERGRVATLVTEFRSVSGYHLENKSRGTGSCDCSLFCFLKENSTQHSSRAQNKNIPCVIKDVKLASFQTSENSPEGICYEERKDIYEP